ncbi:MAG: UbiA prenyltransferase family protein [Pseudomonadota bacterium]
MPYLKIARFDHWFKNVFVLPGVVVALYIDPSLLQPSLIINLVWALLAVGFIGSINYTINEILDAPKDALHPVKKNRPVPSGQVNIKIGYVLWIVFLAIGLGFASLFSEEFFWIAFLLWIMGCIYNIPPVRSKDKPYIDVLSEAVNNPIRLLLGWYATGITLLPPISLVFAYWMIGAFFMAAKRFGEYRMIDDEEVAGNYRNSFKYYTEERLVGSLMYYLSGFGLFFGIFLIRYKMELILSIPLIAGFTAWYFHLACKDDSPVQYPEKLYRETPFMIYTLVLSAIMLYLIFVDLPWLHALFPATPV